MKITRSGRRVFIHEIDWIISYSSISVVRALAESESNLKKSISQSKETDRKMYFFRIEDKFLSTHIGEIGYTVNEITPLGKILEVGYFIKPLFWGKGYTSEALEEVIRFAFEENNVLESHADA
ncbi:GNAT family N-acetyltransferase [Paenibacillus urinalis]|uniref:GNAT family N-acetyltransferase n=1 Tax=Paenibacillus urinalis TaxID=521520 RepID=A0ABY7X2Y6_9BACL|nr:GNAT family N-acetyltransferase [Paenibacillus urinalis]WDH96554.1 GNAT family N-acetyltransferase [Paenibacillus urinalis]WDI00200.1 GNAT family N-acetyltransferase [Paenibacillus urinalis]